MAIDLLNIQPHKVSKDLSGYITFVYGPPKVGKAQPVETVIPTPEGNRMLGDIKPGDYVYARNGKPTKVLGVFPQGKLDTYLITLEDGRQTECAGSHLWSVYSHEGENVEYCVRTTQEMYEKGLIRAEGSKRGAEWYKYRLPKCEPLEKSLQDYGIDPYLLGVCLCLADTTQKYFTIRTGRTALIDEIGYALGAEPKYNPKNKTELLYVKNGKYLETEDVLTDYMEYFEEGVDGRRIPEELFEGTIDQRFHLLQGFADAAGIVYDERGQTLIANIPKQLAQDLQQLFYSLGYLTKINQMRNSDYKIDSEKLFNVTIVSAPVEEKKKIFRTYENKNVYKKNARTLRESEKSTPIIGIDKMGVQKEMVCIYVEDEEHLYITNDYIVTHNTTLASQMEDALLLGFEKGYCAIPGIIAQDINSWSELKQVVRQLKRPEVKEKFKCVIVDTVDVSIALLEKYMTSKLGIEEMGDGGWKVNSWPKAKREFEEVFRTISMQGYALFFISHAKEKTIKRPDGSEYDKIVPSVGNAYLGIVENMADIYGYANSIKDANGDSRVVLTVRAPADEMSTGCRFKYIEPQFDFNYESLSKAVNEAIEKEAQLTNNKYVTEERNQAKEIVEIDFDELRAEVNSIIDQLIKKNPEDIFENQISPKIVTIAETYLGKGKKINQCTRDQTEQLLLIKDDLSQMLQNNKEGA